MFQNPINFVKQITTQTPVTKNMTVKTEARNNTSSNTFSLLQNHYFLRLLDAVSEGKEEGEFMLMSSKGDDHERKTSTHLLQEMRLHFFSRRDEESLKVRGK